MTKTNQIGLRTDKAFTIIENLNILLADYVVFYQNMRGLHWNVKGRNFFDLHQKFEEQYEKAQQYADEIAERILSLSGKPLHTLTEYTKASNLIEVYGVVAGQKAVEVSILQLKTLIEELRQLVRMAGDIKDEGTADMLTGMLKAHEKDLWMFNAWNQDL
jgi:starvation-inducible DNA-binding protein